MHVRTCMQMAMCTCMRQTCGFQSESKTMHVSAAHMHADVHICAHAPHLRVPVGVEDDARVCRRQVDADAARPRRDEEGEDGRARARVAVDGGLPLVCTHIAVKTLVGVLAMGEVLGEQVEDLEGDVYVYAYVYAYVYVWRAGQGPGG